MSIAPACFLLPGSWSKYEETVKDCLDDSDFHLRSCFESISRRNANLRKHSSQHPRHPKTTSSKKVINLLDRLYTEHNFGRIAGACLRAIRDHDLLVKTCIEWAASAFRHGDFRVYAAARLLRIWNKHGVELQQPILDLLNAKADSVGLIKRDIYKVLAELVSSKHFSVGKYLQWLMARGRLQSHYQPDPVSNAYTLEAPYLLTVQDGPCDVRLLLELPLQDLPSHVLNLRQTLLSTLGVPAQQETYTVNIMKAKLTEQIPDFFPIQNATVSSAELDVDHGLLSQTVTCAIARWIRQSLILRLQARSGINSGSEDTDQATINSDDTGVTLITLEQFLAIRGVFEDLGDFAVLADFLKLLSIEVHGSTLTAVADTINYYFDVFNAIGAAADLFRSLCYQHEDVSSHGLTEKCFLESLIDLGCRLPDAAQVVQRLRKELSAYAPKPSAAACSPISDTMVEAVQSSEPAFADDMDQMLASGTSMDDPMLSRVFATITAHLGKSLQEPDCSITRMSQLLTRLRGFGPKIFDELLLKWLQSWLQLDSRPKLSLVLPPLICSKIVSLKTVLATITQSLRDGGNGNSDFGLALDTMELIAEGRCQRMPVVDYRRYRMFNQVDRLVRISPSSLITVIRMVIKGCSATDPLAWSRAQDQVRSSAVRSLIKDVLLQRHEAQSEIKTALNTLFLDASTLKAVGGLLYQEQVESTTLTLSTKIIRLLDNVSDFNTPLAQLELRTLLNSAVEPPEVSTRILSDILIRRARTSATARIELWACLVTKLPTSQAASVREAAETELLSGAVKDMISMSCESKIGGLISIVEAAASSVPDSETSPLLDQISEGLASLAASPQLEKYQHRRLESDPVFQYIDVILRLLTVHQNVIQHPKFSQSAFYQILMSLALLCVHPSLIPHPTLTNRLFDVLTLFSDSLPDDTRSRCIRALRDQHQTRDPRIRFIFGYAEIVEKEWLQLVTKSASAAESKTDGTPTTKTRPYPLRRWEMMQDATPVATENDTSLSLTLFGARKSVL